MECGHGDLARLERLADGRELHLLAYADTDDPMALASTDTWHLHVFSNLDDLTGFVEGAEDDGTLDDLIPDETWGMPDVAEVLDDPGPILDVTFHV